MTADDRSDAILLYAAGLLEGAELRRLEEQLRAGDFARELREARALVAQISLGLDPVEPSPESKERLLAQIASSAPPIPEPAARSGRMRLALVATIAALLGAAIATALSYWLGTLPARREAGLQVEARAELERANRALEEEREELDRVIAQQDVVLGELQQALELADEQIHMLHDPDLDLVVLAATDLQPEASAWVFWEWDDYSCYLHATGLSQADAGRTYALWVFNDAGGVVRVGTFTPDDSGEVTYFAKLRRDIGRVVRVVITDEPTDVAEQPSGPDHLVWQSEPRAS
jgi:anti-sigma-K factor RskA